MADYKKFPYRSEFPDSSEMSRNHQTLEDALDWSRRIIHGRWRETNEYGVVGEYLYDVQAGVVTNRNTGYRWLLRRDEHGVEFQTPEMVEEVVGAKTIDLHLSIEEAEALARAAKAATITDKRTRALMEQALDQIGLLCRQVRERVRAGDTVIAAWASGIPQKTVPVPQEPTSEASTEPVTSSHTKYRPLGEPDNLSLKEAGEILGKARNTLYLWYRQGKFPPAVDVGPHLRTSKPVIVVPRYRLEAWQAGGRMPEILEEVFEGHTLHEPPWMCWTVRKGSSRKDVEFLVRRRAWQAGTSKDGTRIYSEGIADRVCELVNRELNGSVISRGAAPCGTTGSRGPATGEGAPCPFSQRDEAPPAGPFTEDITQGWTALKAVSAGRSLLWEDACPSPLQSKDVLTTTLHHTSTCRIRSLFVGIDCYWSTDIRELPFAERDALGLHALISDTLGPGGELLVGEQVTREDVAPQFPALRQSRPDDLVVIGFSGHDSETHELVPYDTDVYDIANSCIPLEELTEWFKAIPPKLLVCILDYCFSGAI